MVMTATQDVPRERWPGFFDELSRTYEGWRVTIELLGRDVGDQPIASDMPLQGISFETAGTQAGDVLVEAGDRPEAYMTHAVRRAKSVRITDSQPGNEVDVEIEPDEGPVTLVRLFRLSELPGPERPDFEKKITQSARSMLPTALWILAGTGVLLGVGIWVYRQQQRPARRFWRRTSSALGWDYWRSRI